MLIDLDNLMEKYNMNVQGVIHIGAHQGHEHSAYKKNNINNIIYFEPSSVNFGKLTQRVGDEGICINKAIGSSTGKIKMYVETANEGQSSSILRPKLHAEMYRHIVFHSEEIVDIDLLDNIQEINDKPYNFINIDVQGYELEVFKGATKTLKNIDYIMTEINKAEIYENCPMVEDLDEFLSQYGFKRVETSWFYDHNWGDAFYIKELDAK